MFSDLVLCRQLNNRNIELHHTTRGHTVGVLRRDGSYQYVPWLGFVGAADARLLAGSHPVKLAISRIGCVNGVATVWEDVGRDKHVQGCLVPGGAYAVVKGHIRVV